MTVEDDSALEGTTVNKTNCVLAADLLALYGVRHCVVCPGSRNAPLNVALSRRGVFGITTAVDERAAAFMALGMAKMSRQPVALSCTSGTALLNMAPAVAEAYYCRVPLIILSADRPAAWIDQRDSQTMRQVGALANIVRDTVDVPDNIDASYANRLLNRALTAALGPIPGPVHINLPLDRPLTAMTSRDRLPHGTKIATLHALTPAEEALKELCKRLSASKSVMVVAGSGCDIGCHSFPGRGNIVFMTDASANCRCGGYRPSMFDGIRLPAHLAPEVVVNLGGNLISDHFKGYLRKWNPEVVNIGFDDEPVETFGILRVQVEMKPQQFLAYWAAYLNTLPDAVNSGYARLWADTVPQPPQSSVWSDYAAMRTLRQHLGPGSSDTAVFVANGMVARYAQLIDWGTLRLLDQRGVSGIEGCTSTAMGASMVHSGSLVLLTGDMGAAYDIGALALPSRRFKMVVFDNDGGDIFRHVATTANLPEHERDRFCVCSPHLPLQVLAQAYGFSYYRATCEAELAAATPRMMANDARPCILHIITQPQDNETTYNSLFNHDNK